MIVVDTSVWIAAFRRRENSVAQHLAQLLDDTSVVLVAPVRLEILNGASNPDRIRLARLLNALPLLLPSPNTWAMVELWVEQSRTTGQQFGIMDLLIAALAQEHDHAIWSLDNDFQRMGRLKFIRNYIPDLE